MNKTFSERHGYNNSLDVIQYECMDNNLRMAIYNALYCYIRKHDIGYSDEHRILAIVCKDIWSEHWSLAADTFPDTQQKFYEELRERIFNSDWHTSYDLIEYITNDLDKRKNEHLLRKQNTSYLDPKITLDHEFIKEINNVLEQKRSGYRIVNKNVVPIANEVEIEAIQQCLNSPDRFSGSRKHIRKAVHLLAKKPDPDLENTVKESILSIESAARIFIGTEKGTLSNALDEIPKHDPSIHPALLKGWKILYGFTSDEEGIRHASNTDDNKVKVDFDLAKYMLVSCSAFVNYLVERYDKKRT